MKFAVTISVRVNEFSPYRRFIQWEGEKVILPWGTTLCLNKFNVLRASDPRRKSWFQLRVRHDDPDFPEKKFFTFSVLFWCKNRGSHEGFIACFLSDHFPWIKSYSSVVGDLFFSTSCNWQFFSGFDSQMVYCYLINDTPDDIWLAGYHLLSLSCSRVLSPQASLSDSSDSHSSIHPWYSRDLRASTHSLSASHAISPLDLEASNQFFSSTGSIFSSDLHC
jgi:hypothetical protein